MIQNLTERGFISHNKTKSNIISKKKKIQHTFWRAAPSPFVQVISYCFKTINGINNWQPYHRKGNHIPRHFSNGQSGYCCHFDGLFNPFPARNNQTVKGRNPSKWEQWA